MSVGYHEVEETRFILGYLREGDTVVDVGANIGLYTVLAARRGARVFAFEPGRRTRDALLENVALNRLTGNVDVLPHALSDFVGVAAFTDGLDVADHLILGDHGSRAQTVAVTTLDAISQSRGLTNVSLLKIDAEGSDENVLRGAARLLAEDLPVVIIETWSGGSEIRAALDRLGYKAFRYSAGARELREIRQDFHADANLIFVHISRIAGVEARLVNAPTVEPGQPSVRWFGSSALSGKR